MFEKKDSDINKQIIGFTKARKILFFTIKPKPIYGTVEQKPAARTGTMAETEAAAKGQVNKSQPSTLMKNLGPALLEVGIKMTAQDYVKKCNRRAMTYAVAAGILTILAVFVLGYPIIYAAASLVIALFVFMFSYQLLVNFPIRRTKSVGTEIEKDVLFAARDMIVSMRSGVPLFNAMATVSVGYGAASREFEKIIDRVQLGMPMDQAIDEVSSKSGSPTFKKLMLQASTSIKVGSDLISALQEVINDVSQERVIELRRYGQRLNAIAMFYMLFGVIFPSMGIAIAAIMSTFISIFTLDDNTLIFAIFGLAFLQFIFLRMVASSRPSFAT